MHSAGSYVHLLVFCYESPNKMRHHCVVEVQPIEVSVTDNGFDIEESRTYVHARINVQEGRIQCAIAKVEYKHNQRE